MPDGEMRRPPQPWEKKLARLTSIVGGAGISSSGDGTGVVPPTPVPGSGGGTEPAPVLPAPGAFIKPSTPTLLGQVQGINVIWDGLNSASELWPYDTSWVEIHMSTAGTAFTPGTATLKGRLTRPGAYSVGGLTAGTAYYFKLRGADPAGNVTEPSDAAVGYTGLTTSSDYGTATIGTGAVSFNARTIGGVTTTVGTATPSSPIEGDIWLDTTGGATTHKRYTTGVWQTQAWGTASLSANCITATQIAAGAITSGAIAAGAVTTDKLTAGTITGFRINGGTMSAGYISGGTMSAGYISGGTIDGSSLRTASSGARVEIGAAFSALSSVQLFTSSGAAGAILTDLNGGVTLASSGSTKTTVGNSGGGTDLYGPTVCKSTLAVDGAADCNSTLNVDGAGTFQGACTVKGTLDAQAGVNLSASGANDAMRIASTGQVYSYGINDNTTTNAANVRCGASAQLLLSTSTIRVKDELTPLTEGLAGVEPDKLAAFPASVDPYDVLTITPTEFRSLAPADADARNLGFIAEDVAMKFPWAANWDEDGIPSAVEDRPILAALLAVVQQQQQTITDLTARVEALEA